MCCYPYDYAKYLTNNSECYKFWIWTKFWWFMLFGQGISWEQDFFPDVSCFYYKIIACILIAILILSIFFLTIRHEVARCFKFENIPLWNIVLAFLFLGIADIAEHHRIGHQFLIITRERKDLIEELMGIPCMLSLALITFYMQKKMNRKG